MPMIYGFSLIFFCIYDDKKVNKYIEEHSGNRNNSENGSDKNIDFEITSKYNLVSDGALKVQSLLAYGQEEDNAEFGAYKYAKVGAKAGYNLYEQANTFVKTENGDMTLIFSTYKLCNE